MIARRDSIDYLRTLVHKAAAIVVEANKDYLFETRLVPLAKTEGLGTLDALVEQLRARPGSALHQRVIEAMTTNETSFFRDSQPFEMLKKDLIPRLMAARAASRTLRIWCAASSTGQEPYSIALTLRDTFPELGSWNVSILATDINHAVLERARAGCFKQLEIDRGMPPHMLARYFERAGAEWRIKEEVRSLVTFQQLNLLDRWPLLGALDLVFMRNVLIYFDVPTKRALLARVRAALAEDGMMVLGGSETTFNLDDSYAVVRAAGGGVYYTHTAPLSRTGTSGR